MILLFLRHIISNSDQSSEVYTDWGAQLMDQDINDIVPLPDYPRPQFAREDSWKNLNGAWTFKCNSDSEPIKIVVPFSPESVLSRVPTDIQPCKSMTYSRKFTLGEEVASNVKNLKTRVLLHFGAIDNSAKVIINGNNENVYTHDGSEYLPFTFDITKGLINDGTGEQEIEVQVLSSSGKQKSGIWQTVWLEFVPYFYIDQLKLTPFFDNQTIKISTNLNNYPYSGTISLSFYPAGENEPSKLIHKEDFYSHDIRSIQVSDEIKQRYSKVKVSLYDKEDPKTVINVVERALEEINSLNIEKIETPYSNTVQVLFFRNEKIFAKVRTSLDDLPKLQIPQNVLDGYSGKVTFEFMNAYNQVIGTEKKALSEINDDFIKGLSLDGVSTIVASYYDSQNQNFERKSFKKDEFLSEEINIVTILKEPFLVSVKIETYNTYLRAFNQKTIPLQDILDAQPKKEPETNDPDTDNTGTDNTGTDNAGTDNTGTDNTDNTGTDNAGTDNTGTDNTGTDNAGTDNTGTDNTGTDNTGTDNTDNTGTDNTGTDNTGTDNTGTDNTGTDNTGTDNTDNTGTDGSERRHLQAAEVESTNDENTLLRTFVDQIKKPYSDKVLLFLYNPNNGAFISKTQTLEELSQLNIESILKESPILDVYVALTDNTSRVYNIKSIKSNELDKFDITKIDDRLVPNSDFLQIQIMDEDKKIIASQEIKNPDLTNTVYIQIPDNDFHPWTPEKPYLYKVLLHYRKEDYYVQKSFNSNELEEGNTEKYFSDTVTSYFGMRSFGVGRDDRGIPRLYLNGAPYFQVGVLDQGYWSDGLYTAPSVEAIKSDIDLAKSLGFNMIRKYNKIEPLLWYHYCDKAGIIVWQDILPLESQNVKSNQNNNNNDNDKFSISKILSKLGININFDFDFNDKNLLNTLINRNTMTEEEKRRNIKYRAEIIEHLYNCVSIGLWTAFNEGNGQFDALQAVEHIRSLDNTRLIDHASGGYDEGGGDVSSLHIYDRDIKVNFDKKNRVVVLSEFGSYGFTEDKENIKEPYAHKMFETKLKLLEGYSTLIENQIIPACEVLGAIVYRQLSDVQNEVDGFKTANRKTLKFDQDKVNELNQNIGIPTDYEDVDDLRKIIDKAQKIDDFINSNFEQLGFYINDNYQIVNAQLSDNLQNIGAQFSDNVHKYGEKLADNIQSFDSSVKNNLQKFGQKVADNLETFDNQLVDNAHKLSEKIANAIQSIDSQIKDNVQEFKNSYEIFKYNMIGMKNVFKISFERLGNKIINNVQNFGTNFIANFHSMGTNLKEGIQNIGTSFKDGFQLISSQIRDNIHNIASSINANIQNIGNNFNDNVRKIGTKFNENIQKIASELNENIQNFDSTVKENIEKIGLQVRDNINDFATNFNGNIQTFGTNFQENIQSFGSTLNDNIVSMGTQIDANLKENIKKIGTTISENIKNFGTQIKGNIDSFGTNINENVQTISNQLKTNIQSLISQVKDSVQNIDNSQIKENIQKIGEQLKSNLKEFASQIDQTLQDIHNQIDENIQLINDQVQENIEKIDAQIRANLENIDEELKQNVEEIDTQTIQNIQQVASQIKENVHTIDAQVKANIEALVALINESIQNMFS